MKPKERNGKFICTKCGVEFEVEHEITESGALCNDCFSKMFESVHGYKPIMPPQKMNPLKLSRNKVAKYVKDFKIGDNFYSLIFYSETKPKLIQLSIGEVALPYKPKTFKQELKDCFRYFKKENK